MFDPLSTFRLRLDGDAHQLELVAVGMQIYNRWLADVCAAAPAAACGPGPASAVGHRRLYHRPPRRGEVGLAGGQFSTTPRPGMLEVDYPEWDPFWSACEDLGVPLVTHCGIAAGTEQVDGPSQGMMKFLERAGSLSRRALPRFIFSGVFERHPSLRLVYTELMQQGATWWPGTVAEDQRVWRRRGWICRQQCPRPPSEYMASNVFNANSLLHCSPEETHTAISLGYAGNVLWGADYPHVEGTLYPAFWLPPAPGSAMQLSSAGISETWTRAMLGGNAIDVYGLDPNALAKVAERISAPTPADLAAPPPADSVPEYWSGAD